MSLSTFVDEGWRDHADDAEAVMARLPAGLALAATPADLGQLAALAIHVAGEHLGRWDDGVALLEGMRGHAAFDMDVPECRFVVRSIATLHFGAGRRDEADRLLAEAPSGGDRPPASDRVRMLATASSALLGQKRLGEAAAAFRDALDLASYGPTAADPAARALAVTGNNMACELENQSERTPEEVALMLLAAEAGLRFWAVAGTWRETKRAHYRLAMSCLKAGDVARALREAEASRSLARDNGDEPAEVVFPCEAQALAHHALGDPAAARAAAAEAEAALAAVEDASFREYAAGELAKLRVVVGR